MPTWEIRIIKILSLAVAFQASENLQSDRRMTPTEKHVISSLKRYETRDLELSTRNTTAENPINEHIF